MKKNMSKEIREAVKMIEEKSVYRFTAMTDKGGFYIPIDEKTQKPLAIPQHLSNNKILKLAEVMKNKPEM